MSSRRSDPDPLAFPVSAPTTQPEKGDDMNLIDTFTAAGVRTYDITESTDGSVEIALGGGGFASVEPTGEGAGWQFTVREADDTLNRDQWVTDLHWLAGEVGQLYRLSR